MMDQGQFNILVSRITLTVIFILTLGALGFIKSRLKTLKCLNVEALNTVRSKLHDLRIPIKVRAKILRIKCYMNLISSYIILTLAYVIFLLNPEPLLGIPFLLLSVLMLVTTNYLWSVKVSAVRYVKYLGGNVAQVELEVRVSRPSNIRVFDGIGGKYAVLKGSNMVSASLGGNDVLKLKYDVVASYEDLRGYETFIELSLPTSITVRSFIIKPKTFVKRSEGLVGIDYLANLIVKVISKSRTNLREPSIDYVRPYAQGDDIRLIVPKSFLKPSGLSVKILEKHIELSTEEEEPRVVLVLGKYFCRYYLGMLQLKALLNRVKELGFTRLSIGNDRLDIDYVIKNVESVCKEYEGLSHLITYDAKSIVIASPDTVNLLLGYTVATPYVITVKPYIDECIKVVANSLGIDVGKYLSWINELRDNVDRLAHVFKDKVFIYEYIYD